MSRRTCATLIAQFATAAARSRASTQLLTSQSTRLFLAANGSFEHSAMSMSVIRAFQASSRIQTANLLHVLDEEIKHENENYAKPSEIASGPPAPFTLLENGDGDTLVTLVRGGSRLDPLNMMHGVCGN